MNPIRHDNLQAHYDSWFKTFSDSAEPLILFGCTEIGAQILKAFPTAIFTEDKPGRTSFCGRPVVSLDSLPARSLIISTISGVAPRSALLRLWRLGHFAVDCFWFARNFLPGLNITSFWRDIEPDLTDTSSRYTDLRGILSDEYSRFTLDSVLEFRENLDLWKLKDFDCKPDEQYFEPFLRIGPEERFLDVGAYTGDTSLNLLSRVHKADEIHIFEPMSVNLNSAKHNLRHHDFVHFHNVALGEQAGFSRITNNASSSRLSLEEGEVVEVRTLDSFDLRPTLLKIDVEGDELKVLTGAAETIRTHAPRIAVACYHSAKQIFHIPRLILDLNPQYRVFLRHYTESFTETILFFLED